MSKGKIPAPPSAAAWQAAVAHHQAGRLKEAEVLYRQVLAAAPQHFEAKHLLGVVALQSGRLDESAALIQEALAINPKLAAAHNNLGNVRLRQGREADATTYFQTAIQCQPSYGDAHYNLANALRSAGKLREASTHFSRALAGNARWFDAHLNQGATLLALGDARGAVKSFEAAVRLKPDRVDALSNLGLALADAGETQRALDAFARALKLDPTMASTFANQGSVLARTGRIDAARQAFEQALHLAPDHAAAHANLGTLLRENGSAADAIAHFDAALKLDPSMTEPRVGLTLAMLALGRTAEAERFAEGLQRSHPQSSEALILQSRLCMDRNDRTGAERALAAAIAAQPAGAEARYLLGNLQMGSGRWAEALESYQGAVNAEPGHVRARWALVMAQLAPIPTSAADAQKARSNFTRMLADLDKWFDGARSTGGHAAVGSTQPFYLAYQALSNRDLLQKYGALCGRLMAPRQQESGLSMRAAGAHSPVRIGIVSAHIQDHSVWSALIRGWAKHLDKSRFALYVYHLGAQSDAQTEQAARWAHRLESGPRRDVTEWAKLILEHEIDVLTYPEIGMDSTTVRLANMRLAPIQAASWGHPETSGLPSIDYYLSAEDLEPPGGSEHYTERLVTLPRLGVCYEPPAVASVLPDLKQLGLPQDVPLLLCPGVPFKYAPTQDRVWSEIVRRTPDSRLVFFQPKDSDLGRQLRQRLERHFGAAGVAFDGRVSFIPFLDREQFYGLMRRSHLFLDSIGFSGFNTAMQAIECGLPVVTREGDFMRGRLASGILRRLGLDALVAGSDEAYIDLVVSLSGDLARRQALSAQITEKRAQLFGDVEPVRALERFLESAVQQRRP